MSVKRVSHNPREQSISGKQIFCDKLFLLANKHSYSVFTHTYCMLALLTEFQFWWGIIFESLAAPPCSSCATAVHSAAQAHLIVFHSQMLSGSVVLLLVLPVTWNGLPTKYLFFILPQFSPPFRLSSGVWMWELLSRQSWCHIKTSALQSNSFIHSLWAFL